MWYVIGVLSFYGLLAWGVWIAFLIDWKLGIGATLALGLLAALIKTNEE